MTVERTVPAATRSTPVDTTRMLVHRDGDAAYTPTPSHTPRSVQVRARQCGPPSRPATGAYIPPDSKADIAVWGDQRQFPAVSQDSLSRVVSPVDDLGYDRGVFGCGAVARLTTVAAQATTVKRAVLVQTVSGQTRVSDGVANGKGSGVVHGHHLTTVTLQSQGIVT